MKLEIKHQESYSRGELLLRTLFGLIYIAIPHMIVLIFVSLAGAFLNFLAFWAILFTGKYPRSFFDFQVGLTRWNLRLNAALGNLVDGYPAFGLKTKTDDVVFEVTYPESLSRGKLLLKAFFGVIYCVLPHGIILMFRGILGAIYSLLAFWVILFTGKFPASWHKFIVENTRWNARVSLYMGNMTDTYPPFHGRPIPEDEPKGSSASTGSDEVLDN